MRLARLVVRRMPGIDELFILEPTVLGAGVTLIHGPNGVGKSSLCRAVHAVLWPGTLEHSQLSVEARFEDGEHRLIARREGGHVEWQRNGAPCDPPDLPDEHLARCFLITLDDLFAEDRDGRWFAALVMRAMAGGYDLRIVRQELFEPSPQHGRSEARALDEARSLVRGREVEQERVLAEERELGEVESQLAEARATAAELPALEAAVERMEVRARLLHAQSSLAQLPGASARVVGGERERLIELEERAAGLRAKLLEIDRDQTDSRAQHARAALNRALTTEELDEQAQRVDELRECERKLDSAREALAQSEEGLNVVRIRLGEGADPKRLLSAGQLDVDSFVKVLGDSQALANERSAIEAELRLLEHSQGEPRDAGQIVNALHALNGWLRTQEPFDRRALAWGWTAVALGSATAIVLAISLHPAGLALLVLPMLMMIALLRQRVSSERRLAFLQAFSRTNVAPPLEWSTSAVESRIDELERERIRLNSLNESAARRKRLEFQLDSLAEQEREVEVRRAALRSTMGLAVRGSDLSLAILARDLADLRNLDAERRKAEIHVEHLKRRHTQLYERVAAFVRELGEESGEDATSLARALAAIKRRNSLLIEAEATLERCAKARVDRLEELAKCEELQEKIFTELDLEPGDLPGLTRLLDARVVWKQVERNLSDAQAQDEQCATRLVNYAELAALDNDQLLSKRDLAAAAKEEIVELTARIADIRRGVRDARKKSDLENARAVEERARTQLAEAFADAAVSEAGRLLLDEVASEHERQSRPAVLQRASELFAAFTAGRYALRVVETLDGPALRAIDSTLDGLGLDAVQLSGGTRAQLLLAVRLAFASEAEHGVRLPIFVDDALSTSDPDRVRAIAQCLFSLAGMEGRQVIVLTKDEGDVTLIHEQAQGADLHVTDLAAVRRVAVAQTRRERLVLPAARRVPPPQGLDGAHYAQLLGVPALDPWRPFGEAHLYHLLPDEPELLHLMLTSSIERVGPLRALLESGVTPHPLTEAQRTELLASISLAYELYEIWHTGRGKPLTREDLRDCSAISDTFQLRVLGLAEELGWDARALVDALLDGRVKRFQSTKAQEVEAWLQERGHLASEKPFSLDAAWTRLLRSHDALASVSRPGLEATRRRFEYLWQRFEEVGRD